MSNFVTYSAILIALSSTFLSYASEKRNLFIGTANDGHVKVGYKFDNNIYISISETIYHINGHNSFFRFRSNDTEFRVGYDFKQIKNVVPFIIAGYNVSTLKIAPYKNTGYSIVSKNNYPLDHRFVGAGVKIPFYDNFNLELGTKFQESKAVHFHFMSMDGLKTTKVFNKKQHLTLGLNWYIN